jgi:hypothetical protein
VAQLVERQPGLGTKLIIWRAVGPEAAGSNPAPGTYLATVKMTTLANERKLGKLLTRTLTSLTFSQNSLSTVSAVATRG